MQEPNQKQCPNCYSYVEIQEGSGYCTACKEVVC